MDGLKKTIFGKAKVQLVFLAVICLSLTFILLAGSKMPYRILCNCTFQKSQEARSGLGLASPHLNRYTTIVKVSEIHRQRAAGSPTDYTQYVNMVQGPGTPTNSDRQVFMRYPLGRIGLWSRAQGEIPDVPTRGMRIYPMVDQAVPKDDIDWRQTVSGTPSEVDITYNSNSPAKGSTVAMTVTPHISIYKYHFNNVTSYGAVGITLGNVYGGTSWTNNNITVVDNQTMQVTLGNGSHTIYFYIKFNVPGTGVASGNFGYMKFSPATTDVIAAVALSHSSMATAQQFFTNEFSDFNFAAASRRLKDAWNAKLGKIEVQSADQLTTQKLYTGLYTLYANVMDATDGSPYAPYAAAYGSPFIDIGSGASWENYGGGWFRCSFDQGRTIYSLLTLIDPSLMKDILNSYLAQYDYNKVMLGNLDPYCPTCWSDQQFGFFANIFLRAKLMGVTGVDYNKAEQDILDTFGNPKNYMSKSGYLQYGYIPADLDTSGKFMSRALDFATDVQGLALLANSLGDNATYNQWINRGQNYKNNWNAANGVFQGKNSDGTWAARNTGFFEGNENSYGFLVMHDPLGLADLYGDTNMTSKIDSLLTPTFSYNDFDPQYQILPFYSNSPSTAENITRNRFVQQFNGLNMWDDYGSGSPVWYTDNSGELVMTLLGLYPIQAPAAQYVLTSPSVTTAVIHGIKDITIQANNNTPANAYISSIQVNGNNYPSHFISGETLTAHNTTITMGMSSTPSRIGNMYITGTEGEVMSADSDNKTYLRFQNDPIATSSRAKVYATQQPVSVTVNGTAINSWTYNASENIIDIKNIPAGTVLISFGSSVTPPPVNTTVPTGLTKPSSTQSPTSLPFATPTSSFVTPTIYCLGSCLMQLPYFTDIEPIRQWSEVVSTEANS